MKRFFQPVNKDGSLFKKPNLSPTPAPVDKADNENEEKNKKEPLKFVTWNANSFLLRVKNNWPQFTSFIQKLDPDVIAIQEVRMPAAGSKGSAKNPGELKDDTTSSRQEKQILMRAISKLSGLVVSLRLQVCSDWFIDQEVLPTEKVPSKHEADGRVILAEFESFRLLNTYVPNNGWKEDETSFQRRRKWDKRIHEFVIQSTDKLLIWCGDLNVSHQEIDVSHPDFFSSAKQNGYSPPNKEDCIQPGFTLNERKRFGSILSEGKLIDAYRFLHKEKDMDRGFSWSGNPVGKY